MTVLLVVTLVSLGLAVAMSAIAWRVSRKERAREAARVAALAVDIQAAVAAAGGRRVEPMLRAVRPAPAPTPDLFAAPARRASSRPVIAVAVGLFAFATIAAGLVVLTSGTRTAPAAVRAAAPTVDLVALSHERDADRLVVHGIVRNSSSTHFAEPLTAVVFAFNRDGGFVTSGRAAIDASRLIAGGESAFVVTLADANQVARYRVSFRTAAGIVAHVDRRQGS